MLEPIFATAKTYFVVVDTVLVVVKVARQYRDYIVNALILVLAFFIGKFLSRKNQSELYFQQFNNSTKDRQHLALQIAQKRRFYLLANVGGAVALLGHVFAFIQTNRALIELQDADFETVQQRLLADPRNYYISWSFFASVLIFILVRKYCSFRLSGMSQRMGGMGVSQGTYVERFLGIVGPEMETEVRRYFLKDWQSPVPDDKELLLEIEANKRRIGETFGKVTVEERAGRLMRERLHRAKDFDWCVRCRADGLGKNCGLVKAHEDSAKGLSMGEFADFRMIYSQVKKRGIRTGKMLTSKLFGLHSMTPSRDAAATTSETHSMSDRMDDSETVFEARVCRQRCALKYVHHVLEVMASPVD